MPTPAHRLTVNINGLPQHLTGALKSLSAAIGNTTARRKTKIRIKTKATTAKTKIKVKKAKIKQKRKKPKSMTALR